MRLKKSVIEEIREYLRLHYRGGDISPVPRPAPVFRAAKAPAPPVFKQAGAADKSAPKKAADDAFGYAARSAQEEPVLTPSVSAPAERATQQTIELEDIVRDLDESFQQALLRMIDERGMKDSTCYKRAGVDRKLFSKIRGNPAYKPSKSTAIAFALALELSLDETAVFLRKAGYALSRSSKFDVIVEYFIVSGRYDLRALNEALYEFDQPLIGV